MLKTPSHSAATGNESTSLLSSNPIHYKTVDLDAVVLANHQPHLIIPLDNRSVSDLTVGPEVSWVEKYTVWLILLLCIILGMCRCSNWLKQQDP